MVLWRGAAGWWRVGGWGLGLKNITRGTLYCWLVIDVVLPCGILLFLSCSRSGCIQQHVRRHSSCWPWLWLGGTAVCVNKAIATQTSKAAVLEQTRAPLRLHKAPGYVNNDLMRMRAITVINTAHVKALSAFKSFRKVLYYMEKAGMQWPEAVP